MRKAASAQKEFPPREEWLNRFRSVLDRPGEAKTSMDHLVADGMDAEAIMNALYLYASHTRAGYLREVASRSRAIVKSLEGLIKAIGAMHPHSHFQESDRHLMPLDWPATDLEILDDQIDEVAVRAAMLLDGLRPWCNTKGKLRDEQPLVWLLLDVNAVTGRYHWNDVSSLLGAIYSSRVMGDPERLRKVFGRFQKRHPAAFIEMSNAAKLLPRGQKSATAATSRSTKNRRIAQPKRSSGVRTYTIHERKLPKGN